MTETRLNEARGDPGVALRDLVVPLDVLGGETKHRMWMQSLRDVDSLAKGRLFDGEHYDCLGLLLSSVLHFRFELRSKILCGIDFGLHWCTKCDGLAFLPSPSILHLMRLERQVDDLEWLSANIIIDSDDPRPLGLTRCGTLQRVNDAGATGKEIASYIESMGWGTLLDLLNSSHKLGDDFGPMEECRTTV